MNKTCVLLVALSCLSVRTSVADEPKKATLEAERLAKDEAVRSNWKQLRAERKWKTDPALAAQVSFTAQREPLGEFLKRLSTLGNTRFVLPENSPLKAKKLTAAVSDMPLRDVLENLNRLYAITWDESPEGGYSAVELELNEIERGIWQFGDLTSWASPELSMSGPKRKALAQALLQHLNPNTLKTPAGQPLSSVPADLQTEVRKTIEWQSALSLVDAHTKALLPNIANSSLRLRRPAMPEVKEGATEKAPTPGTAVYMVDTQQKMLTPLGQFGVVRPAPKPVEEVKVEPVDDGRMKPY